MRLIRSVAIIMIVFTFLCSCDQNVTKKVDSSLGEVKQLQNKIDELELKLKQLEKDKTQNIKAKTDKNKGIESITEEQRINSSECELVLYDSYAGTAGEEPLFVAAYGPLASLNLEAINSSNAMSIISQDKHLTKIKIEGYIPTWYLSGDKEIIICNENRYIINDCGLYLSPNSDDKLVNELSSGCAVEVKYQYGTWKYVSLYLKNDSNEITNGWVEEKHLGSINDFKSNIGVNVLIKEGCLCIDGEETVVADENMWGRILEEKERSYIISLPGAWFLEVKKSDVEFLH